MSEQEYTVTLRIGGKTLIPSDLTQELGLQPAHTVSAGDRLGDTKVAAASVWSYEGGVGGDGKRWRSLEEGLCFLLDRLEPLRDKVLDCAVRYEVTLWCGYFHSSFGGGPMLSPAALKRLGEFGVELFIDTYYGSDDSQSP